LINYYGRWRKKEIVPKHIMGKPQAFQFENSVLSGIEDYHTYLSTLYGDYMQLPPEDRRESHTTIMRYKQQPASDE